MPGPTKKYALKYKLHYSIPIHLITNVYFVLIFTLPILQADDRLLQDAKDEKELGELIRVYKDQENELYELRARLARFMTKGRLIY